MANDINFNGSAELDNGMTVAVHYQLDEGDNAGTTENNVWDNHSVTVSSDALGTLVFAGHGGSTALSQFDTTAAGDIHDNFDTQIGTAQSCDINCIWNQRKVIWCAMVSALAPVIPSSLTLHYYDLVDFHFTLAV